MLLLAIPVMLILFVLFPRIPGPLWGLPKDAYEGRTGLSEEMAPGTISALELEHYPGMTEQAIERMIDEAMRRFELRAARVVHRVGPLAPGDQIVLVAVSAAHRGAAFQGCEFLIDYLKTQAPFWKKESGADGASWVDARSSDDAALERWGLRSGNAA